MPSDADLRSLVRFSTDDGLIWLSGQRMLLMHSATLMELRKELMNTLGPGHTRRVLMRGGYAAGERDALLARYRELKARGVLVRHFTKERIKDFCRITIGTREQMQILLTNMQDILTEKG